LGGKDAQFELKGSNWDYVQRGYEVELRYAVQTDLFTFGLTVTVRGEEGGKGGGRQWQVVKERTLISQGLDSQVRTLPEAEPLLRAAGEGKEFVERTWLNRLSNRDFGGAYLDTLPLAQRERQARARARAAVPLLAAVDPDVRAYREGLTRFFKG